MGGGIQLVAMYGERGFLQNHNETKPEIVLFTERYHVRIYYWKDNRKINTHMPGTH